MLQNYSHARLPLYTARLQSPNTTKHRSLYHLLECKYGHLLIRRERVVVIMFGSRSMWIMLFAGGNAYRDKPMILRAFCALSY